MNLIRAYMKSRYQPRRVKNVSILPITHELIEQMLDLPSGVYIRGIHDNYQTNTMDIVLESLTPIDEITFETQEGCMMTRIDVERFVEERNR